ncbi:MAG TPA: DUF6496 domain-containing protein [Candidatus Paceibacterota bacterium]|nr:DUF6496 domain-containing protein [Candidatus Paceibacterota bacterium]
MSKHKKHGQKKVATVMREFHQGTLHSGSKKGPVVTNPAQAKAIAMSEAGMAKKAPAKKRRYRKGLKQIFGG